MMGFNTLTDFQLRQEQLGDDDKTKVVLLISFILYIPFVLLGYGTDSDTYRVLETGRKLLSDGVYVPSRPPGYFLFSLITGILDLIGGSILTNLGSLLMSLIIVYTFIKICKFHNVPHRHLLSLGLVFQPYFLVSATSTVDYLWALGFLLVGYYFLLKEQALFAGILFGIAVGFRASSAFFVIALFASSLLLNEVDLRRYLISMLVGGIIGVLWYIPPLFYADFNILWILPSQDPASPMANDWTLFGYIGRFGYKQLYFWGFLPVLFLLFTASNTISEIIEQFHEYKIVAVQSFMVILSTEILYLRAPLEPEYLLPLLPFVLILLGIGMDRKRLIAFILLISLFNVISIDFICFGSYNSPLQTMEIGVYIQNGYTLFDSLLRINGDLQGPMGYFKECGIQAINVIS